MSSAADRWFPSAKASPRCALDLFCLPYAGGSSAAFRGWSDGLRGSADVLPAQLPGRETRITEPPGVEVATLTDALAGAVLRRGGRPYAVYGHSMGARLAFEMLRELRRRDLPLPVRLFVGGARPPHMDVPLSRIAGLPDGEFCDRLVAMGGTPPGVLDEPELRALLLPVLRSDFAMVESYTYHPGDPLPVPVVGFAGSHDPEAHPCDMVGWSAHTTGQFALHTLPGDHFFCHSARGELLNLITRYLHDPPTAVGDAPIGGPPGDGEVCVLEARLDGLDDLCAARAELSPSERRRAAALSGVDAGRLVGRSALLRRVLTGMGVPVGTAELSRGPHGKPAVVHHTGLRFNASHSHGVALLAFTCGGEVGVDVERVGPVGTPGMAEMDRQARDAFTPAELAELAGVPDGARLPAALRLWTAKQAALKASGDGPTVAPARLEFAGQADARTWRARADAGLDRLAGWRVRHLDLAGSVAALALGTSEWRLRYLTVREG